MNRKERRTARKTGKIAGSQPSGGRAFDPQSDDVERLCNLARGQLARGETLQAFQTVWWALAQRETPDAKAIFIGCFSRIRSAGDAPELRGVVARAVSEAWSNINDFSAAACDLAKHCPPIAGCLDRVAKAWPTRLTGHDLWSAAQQSSICSDPLLLALLQSAPVADLDFERFLTSARSTLLQDALAPAATEPIKPAILEFYCALARQCFINEYVYAATEEELGLARQLQQLLLAALNSQADVPLLWPVAVAAYFPLHSSSATAALLDRPWPAALADLLIEQIREPRDEAILRNSIPVLTPVDNAVSLAVKAQYEENPFPRWVKTPANLVGYSVADAMRILFPITAVRPSAGDQGCDVLVAGCGTGRHSIEAAQRFKRARVLAVDLSLASLSYAKRKTRELGLSNIEYAQADILRIGSIRRDFDVIESGGVLHHLDDPFAGWSELISLLRPGGVMCVGLYSTIGRARLAAAQTFIAERGYRPIADDIRRFRQDVVTSGLEPQLRNLLRSSDFFNMSGCRDLFFHVQEHRLDLLQIKSFINDHDLEFLGFVLEPQATQSFLRRFPNERNATNLDLWHIFEMEHPDFFVSMYNFWIQKRRSSVR